VICLNARNVRIGGGGLLQGGLWPDDGQRRNNILFAHCQDVLIEDILLTAEHYWMIHLGHCENVRIHRVREIGSCISTDGIDIVGSRNVTISGCCLQNGDDCIVLKAIDFSVNLSHSGSEGENFAADVENIRVTDCILQSMRGGSAMEIGYETRTSHIRDVRFENIDVLAVHEFGSVFGIHNGDRATVEDIHWRDIRVEHHYDKLIDFRVLKSRWNFDTERGRIRNVILTDIQVLPSIYNPGYTLSVMAGFDADHPVKNIRLENFRLGTIHVLNPDQLDLVTRHAHHITFE
jgi:polygalacturonase